MAATFPEEERLKQKNKILNEILQTKYQVKLTSFFLQEDFDNNISTITCTVTTGFLDNLSEVKLKGTGIGAIGTLFDLLLEEYSKYFFSLKRVKFYDFLVRIKFQNHHRTISAPVEVKVAIEAVNNNNKLYFKGTSSSLMRAGVGAVCKTIEHLINAELAVQQLYKDILDAKKRSRGDLVDIYTNFLIELTDFISYEEIINLK